LVHLAGIIIASSITAFLGPLAAPIATAFNVGIAAFGFANADRPRPSGPTANGIAAGVKSHLSSLFGDAQGQIDGINRKIFGSGDNIDLTKVSKLLTQEEGETEPIAQVFAGGKFLGRTSGADFGSVMSQAYQQGIVGLSLHLIELVA
jgi:hypothetical protein